MPPKPHTITHTACIQPHIYCMRLHTGCLRYRMLLYTGSACRIRSIHFLSFPLSEATMTLIEPLRSLLARVLVSFLSTLLGWSGNIFPCSLLAAENSWPMRVWQTSIGHSCPFFKLWNTQNPFYLILQGKGMRPWPWRWLMWFTSCRCFRNQLKRHFNWPGGTEAPAKKAKIMPFVDLGKRPHRNLEATNST